MKIRFKSVRIILSGFLIGMAMILPGMSWPTMALIIGVYEPLILILGKLASRPKTITPKEWGWLLLTAIGIIPSAFFTSLFILGLLKFFSFQISAFFIGLIIGSIYLLYHEFKKKGFYEIIWFVIGVLTVGVPLIFGIRISDIKFFSTVFGIKALDFISGFAVSTALPAIGDTIMLLLLGNYEHLLIALKTFDLITISIFISGFVSGFFIFVRIISALLKKYRSQTYAFIIGLMVASISSIWPFEKGNYSVLYVILFSILASLGFFISVFPSNVVKRISSRGDEDGKRR